MGVRFVISEGFLKTAIYFNKPETTRTEHEMGLGLTVLKGFRDRIIQTRGVGSRSPSNRVKCKLMFFVVVLLCIAESKAFSFLNAFEVIFTRISVQRPTGWRRRGAAACGPPRFNPILFVDMSSVR